MCQVARAVGVRVGQSDDQGPLVITDEHEGAMNGAS
jgi:hypothetical protein